MTIPVGKAVARKSGFDRYSKPAIPQPKKPAQAQRNPRKGKPA